MRKLIPNQYKWFLAGAVLTAALTIPLTSFAESVQKMIKVTYADIKVTLNGQAVDLKDSEGTVLHPFNYDGSIFVPIRGVSEALGMNVSWDGENNTVVIQGGSGSSGGMGMPPGGQPSTGGNGSGAPGGGAGGMGSVTIPESVTDVSATITKASTSDTSACRTGTATAQIVCLANAFKATLTDEQIDQLQYDMTLENAKVWSNLPVDLVKRSGLMIGALSVESVEAFKALAVAALGESGYETFKQINLGDDYLSATNKAWDSDHYFIAFLGEPSESSAWIMQIGGHHYASNMTFNSKTTSATPMFVGIEPLSFTAVDGNTYTPLSDRSNAMYNMLHSLDDAQTKAAKLSQTFDDVLVGPGEDYQFPTNEGLSVSELSDDQKALVKKAIEAWVKDTNSVVSKELLDAYLSDEAFGLTKIAWSGSTELNKSASYVRIDGPRVWIEFVCQGGIAVQNEIHYHTIWRDKEADYGGSFSSKG